MKHLLGYIISFIILNVACSAQSPVLKNFTINNGLPSNEAYSLYRDSKGFIWICTDAGLVKYDANTFRTFNSLQGLPDNTVFEVREDRQGRIWYRTLSGNIGYIQHDSVFTIKANPAILDFIGNGLVSSFYIDENDIVYLGRQSGEETLFLQIRPPYGKKDTAHIWRGTDNRAWLDIVVFPDGNFLHAENRSTIRGPREQIRFYDPEHRLILTDSLKGKKRISPLTRFTRKNERFAIGNEMILKEYNLLNGSKKTTETNEIIINVYLTNHNELMVGYRDKGVVVFNGDTSSPPANLLLKDLSNSFILEDGNNIWYSTLKNGLFFTSNVHYTQYEMPNGDHKSIRFFNFVGKDIYLAFEGGDCYLYKLGKGGLQLKADMNEPDNSDGNVSRAEQVSADRAIVSYMSHSHQFIFSLGKTRPLSNPLLRKTALSKIVKYKGQLLGFAYTSAFVFDTLFSAISLEVKSADRLTSFAYDTATDKGFFGAIHGLYRFYGQQTIEKKDRLYDFRIKDLQFLEGRLYIATKDLGLLVLSGSTLDTIDVSKGLIGNVCEKIIINGKDCWVSSNMGLSRITYKGYKQYDIVNYPLRDFETPALIQDFCIHDSTLYFASGPYLYSYPLREHKQTSIPFYLYDIKANDISMAQNKGLDLVADRCKIEISFAALYYNFKGKVKYRYKLLPNDQSWMYTNENAVVFPNLSAGSYTFVVQAQRNDGSWLTCNEKINFTIQKPVWRRWWFILLLVLAGIAIASYITYFLYKRKIEREQRTDQAKLRLNNLEIKAMKAQMNPHFMFNALNSIQHFILAGANDDAYRYLSRFSKLVRMLLESNEKETLSVDAEINILQRYLEIETLRLKKDFLYSIRVDPSLEITKKIPHMMIQPFVENAIWHGLLHKKGDRRLLISFTQRKPGEIECIIDDNGIGIKQGREVNKALHSKSIGMDNIRERLNLFSKTTGRSFFISVVDKSEIDSTTTGTIITICLPVFSE